MKLIFLDIDGVLATKDSYQTMLTCQGKEYPSFDIGCVNALNTVLVYSDAKIVISSTWRKLYKFDVLKAILKKEGVAGEVVGHTPMHLSRKMRGDEIKDYLGEHPCDEFVILDDDVWDIVCHEDLKGFTVHVEDGFTKNGMGLSHVRKAIEILNQGVPNV